MSPSTNSGCTGQREADSRATARTAGSLSTAMAWTPAMARKADMTAGPEPASSAVAWGPDSSSRISGSW